MNNRNLEDYEEKYNDKDHYDFETFQIEFRRRNTLTLLNKNIHGSILEIGCGMEPLFGYLDDYTSYTVVEPSGIFYNVAKELVGDDKRIDGLNEMVAAAVCIALSDEVLYVLYWGDSEGMQKYSPISLLAKHIYEHAQSQSFAKLDVGTSTLLGKANYGLVKFKRNLGFRETVKLEFIKNIDDV